MMAAANTAGCVEIGLREFMDVWMDVSGSRVRLSSHCIYVVQITDTDGSALGDFHSNSLDEFDH